MSIEPHAVISVSTPAIRTARQDKPATLADYLANIARRFPECLTPSGAANPAALAKRENRAMWKHAGRHDQRLTEEPKTDRVQALRYAFGVKREARNAAILDYLREARTCGDVVTRFKISEGSARECLCDMKQAGKVIMWRERRMAFWQAVQEAAE
jgi:hypothetical protein